MRIVNQFLGQRFYFVNDLAKSIDISKDGKTYNVTLRDGLKWSNGAKLRAADFVYGWQRTVDPKTGSQYAYDLNQSNYFFL